MEMAPIALINNLQIDFLPKEITFLFLTKIENNSSKVKMNNDIYMHSIKNNWKFSM